MEKSGEFKRRLVGSLIIVLVIIISLVVWDNCCNEKKLEAREETKCSIDSDCVAEGCCHSSSCVNLENKPDCEGMYCSQMCEPGTLDCGQGSCKCTEGKCQAIIG